MASTDRYPWIPPYGDGDAGDSRLIVSNSLTGTKVPFCTSDGTNSVKWYICGPTVYDSAHLGHARSYVSFDIVRRIMEDYFGYDMIVQMNITDIEDKIIRRSQERGMDFLELARQFESEFFDDLRDLGVRPPTYLTRVTEYVPEIVSYVSKIIENGFAYESSGSVYFSVESFVSAGHNYAKLEPWSIGNAEKLAEGEGVLASDEYQEERKSKSDFVIWKKSKGNEPSWESPWGQGRPGWHVECAVMATKLLGETLDIHAGGVDLRFPHHDNETALAEAHLCSEQWVNYFLHAGHLHIEGLKMSKSLKNFITIRSVLQRYNARQIRMLFLLHKYDSPMNYSEEGMNEAVNVERSLAEFFGTVKAVLRDIGGQKRDCKPTERDLELLQELKSAKETVRNCLSDNFNTPGAMNALIGLIRSTNSYLKDLSGRESFYTVGSVASYITRILTVFGVNGDDKLGFADASSDSSAMAAILDAFAGFRDTVKQTALGAVGSKIEIDAADLLLHCDQVRDDVLPPLGVRLEDRGVSEKSVWKMEDPEVVMREIERKRAREEEKRAEKERRAIAAREAELALLEKGKVPPENMFKIDGEREKYSEWDADGMPTKMIDGTDVTKSGRKKLEKERERQTKLHKRFLDAVEAGMMSKNPDSHI